MSFFRALFDLSFSEYVTTKIIKLLYVLTIIFAAILWLIVLVASFLQKPSSALTVIGAIIICPIGFIIQLIFTRVGYEILIVVFGIAENVHDMAWALTGGRKAPGVTPPAPQYPQPGQYVQPPQYPPQPPQQQYPQYPQYPPQAGGQQYPPQQKP
jgi:hypothetical protein